MLTKTQQILGFVFDLDGVLVDTTALHAEAWGDAFALMGLSGLHYDLETDYLEHFDGRDALQACGAFLTLRTPLGPRGSWDALARQVTQRKSSLYSASLLQHGVPIMPGARSVLGSLRERGYPLGVASSSRSGRQVLEAAGLAVLVDVVVDGSDLSQQRLVGKPDPAVYRLTSTRLRIPPERLAAVEDAPAGVVSATEAGYGLVIGLAKEPCRGRLLRAGASTVISQLHECLLILGGETPSLRESGQEGA